MSKAYILKIVEDTSNGTAASLDMAAGQKATTEGNHEAAISSALQALGAMAEMAGKYGKGYGLLGAGIGFT